MLRPGAQPDVLTAPPLLIIEVLSPDDSYSSIQKRCQDYLALGVQTHLIIDPETRSGRMCLDSGWVKAERLEVTGTPIYVSLNQLFSQINTPSN